MRKIFFVFFLILPFVPAISIDCPDAKNDGVISVLDLVKVAKAIQQNDIAFDITGDGKTDVQDLQAIALNFGISCIAGDSDYASLVNSLGISPSLKNFNLDQELGLRNSITNFQSLGRQTLYDHDSAVYSQTLAGGQSKTAIDSDFFAKYAELRNTAQSMIYSSCRTNQSNAEFENYYTVFLRAAVYKNTGLNGETNYAVALDAAKASALIKMQDNADCVIPVFVFAGQSNMVGWNAVANELPAELQQANSKALFLNNDAAVFSALAPPTENVSVGYRVGPEAAAAKKITDSLGRQIAVIKYAVGGTNLCSDWSAWGGDNHFKKMKDRVNNGIQKLKVDKGLIPLVKIFFWQQGESDMYSQNCSASYYLNLQQLMDKV
ncbi:MAG: sialate O-acetylesterase, partial [Candidatus Diapherotrites archaeon]|nr:sialate O-acetylesterase [Candidatus Diapherotrites archaeon]